jgi:hypothetical protein
VRARGLGVAAGNPPELGFFVSPLLRFRQQSLHRHSMQVPSGVSRLETRHPEPITVYDVSAIGALAAQSQQKTTLLIALASALSAWLPCSALSRPLKIARSRPVRMRRLDGRRGDSAQG